MKENKERKKRPGKADGGATVFLGQADSRGERERIHLRVLESVFVGWEYGLTVLIDNKTSHGLYIEEVEVTDPETEAVRCEDITRGPGGAMWSPVWVPPWETATLGVRMVFMDPAACPGSGVLLVMVSPAHAKSKVALRTDFLIRSWTRPDG